MLHVVYMLRNAQEAYDACLSLTTVDFIEVS